MPDLNPEAQAQQLTPRRADLVDALSEVRRVSDATVKANPLRNAVVDDGLMRWRGNYGGDFMWVGEFTPEDPVLDKPQRGVILRRDDPSGTDILRAYDPNPDPSGPLRQRLIMLDANGNTLLQEGDLGGLVFPQSAVPLNVGRAYEPAGAPKVNVLSLGAGTWYEVHTGWVPNTGHKWRHYTVIVAGGSPPIEYEMRLHLGGYVGGTWTVITSDAYPASGAAELDMKLDIAETNLWPRNRGYLQCTVAMRFTTIPGWVGVNDVIRVYPHLSLLYSTAEGVEEPGPP